jgi:hypothetical protein
MTVEFNTGFVAEGPLTVGFETRAANLQFGVNVAGTRCGVVGISGDHARDSEIDKVGVYGEGDRTGVFGNGNPGKVGVFGQHNGNRNPDVEGVKAAVIGSSMGEAIGVIGLSDIEIRPISLAVDENDPANGPKGRSTGVLGLSGQGAGVKGLSRSNTGVMGLSDTGVGVDGKTRSADAAGVSGSNQGGQGPGVRGISLRGRGGVFESVKHGDPRLVAQIQLPPQKMDPPSTSTQDAKPRELVKQELRDLPANGQSGDLLTTIDAAGSCTLWLCVQDNDGLRGARWSQVLLGQSFFGKGPDRM